MGLTASEFDLSKVFSVDYQYEVPTYQRPYSWGVDEAITLLDDLAGALAAPDVPYFLGSVVLVKRAERARLYDVIDGQQRLTTLVILICVLRHLESDPEIRSGLEAMINEPGNKLLGIAAEPRLNLRERDRAFFRAFLQDGSIEDLLDTRVEDLDNPAQRRMKENMHALFEALVGDFDADRRRALAFYLTRQVFLVMIVSDDFASAHRIFGVLNSRGLPLSASDIFKSHVVGAIDDRSRGEYAERWDDAAHRLGDTVDGFFQHLLVLETRSDVSHNLVEDFPTRVLEPYMPDRGAAFVDDVLTPYARAFEIVRRPSDSNLDGRIRLWLTRLGEYPTSDWMAAAVWIVRHVGEDVEEAVELLRLLERITAVDAIVQASRPQRRARIVRIVRELQDGHSGHAGGLAVTDIDRRRALSRLRGEMPRRLGGLPRLFLARANDQAAGAPIEAARSLHVVRVLPGDGIDLAAWPALSEARRGHWRDRLANLVLGTVQDGRIRERDLAGRVRAVFAKSGSAGFPLTRELADIPEWTPEVLEDRQNAVVGLLADFWDIRRDSEGFDLAALTEEQLSVSPGAGAATRSRRLRTTEIVRAGLLQGGEVLVWDRPQSGERHHVTVTDEGEYELQDGRRVDNPSAAATEVSGLENVSGLRVWRRESDGRLLADLWDTYRRRILGDG